ncbi:F-box/LRR-repeat protein 16 [Dermacentor albipictus]|uniref:F-box/LRR-repeat protein 16 n=1 Tax=Dermacentor albipictus TaxID=60249 RepID=UPI0038FCA8D0
MAEVSFTKRAAAELSRCFNGLAVRAKGGLQHESPATATGGGNTGGGAATATRLAAAAATRPRTAAEMLRDPEFLSRLFSHFRGRERLPLASVCRAWRDALYDDPRHWRDMAAALRCRELRREGAESRRRLLESLERRGMDAVWLVGASDEDLADVVSLGAALLSRARLVALRCSSVSDRGLETLLAAAPRVSALELFGCNELTDAGLWAALRPTVTSLTLADCINVADETLAAVAQLLPALRELNLQAYHVTDASLAHLGGGGIGSHHHQHQQQQQQQLQHQSQLVVLRLRSCWELTNQGLVQLVQAVPQLRELSLSGCTKISDDGVELLAENLRQLRVLDLSWCPRVTDASLEFIACDMTQLQQLTLDRCMHITDIGLGYLSTIPNLSVLYLRWCSQIRDFGLQHLCTMKSLRILSVAGCPQVTARGLSGLAQLRQLQELELTNCPGATAELLAFLREQLPHCLVVD